MLLHFCKTVKTAYPRKCSLTNVHLLAADDVIAVPPGTAFFHSWNTAV